MSDIENEAPAVEQSASNDVVDSSSFPTHIDEIAANAFGDMGETDVEESTDAHLKNGADSQLNSASPEENPQVDPFDGLKQPEAEKVAEKETATDPEAKVEEEAVNIIDDVTGEPIDLATADTEKPYAISGTEAMTMPQIQNEIASLRANSASFGEQYVGLETASREVEDYAVAMIDALVGQLPPEPTAQQIAENDPQAAQQALQRQSQMQAIESFKEEIGARVANTKRVAEERLEADRKVTTRIEIGELLDRYPSMRDRVNFDARINDVNQHAKTIKGLPADFLNDFAAWKVRFLLNDLNHENRTKQVENGVDGRRVKTPLGETKPAKSATSGNGLDKAWESGQLNSHEALFLSMDQAGAPS